MLGISLHRVQAAEGLASWITSENLDRRLSVRADLNFVEKASPPAGIPVIEVRPETSFQTILGLGSSLEPTTCSNLFRLSPAERERVMDRLVSPTLGIGMNLMRICIGTPDFTGDPWYSYCDLPAGETDPELKRFSIARDRDYILPMLKLARERNRDLLFFASPWSPPGWMKSTGTMVGGYLLPRWYPAYAQYFVRFLRAYEAEGLPIYAVTVQNEPGVDRAKEKDPKWHYPSCHWTAEQERDFVRDHLRPALRRAGLRTRLWGYDHNYNIQAQGDDAGIDYPRTLLKDPGAAAALDGVAFHGYVGEPEGMTRFHQEFPKVPIHFTEGSVFGIHGASDLIQRLRNHAASYNAWVTILDAQGLPNNGPFPATHAILKLYPDSGRVEELFEYYAYGQFMKFVPRGAVRLESGPSTHEFNHVAFRTPDGSLVLILANTTDSTRAFAVKVGQRHAVDQVPAKSVMTLRWPQRR